MDAKLHKNNKKKEEDTQTTTNKYALSYSLSNNPLISLSKSETIRWVLLKISYSSSAFCLACAAEILPLSGNI